MTTPDMGQCRWLLECRDPATAEVTVESLDMTTVACARHAQIHAEWSSRYEGRTVLNPSPEPEPDCWCPDFILDGSSGEPPPGYCPAHGTAAERGLEAAL